MSYERRSFAGGAADTALTSGISNSATSIVIDDATGWPTGASGDFFIVLERALVGEEKVRIASRSGNTLTVQTSGRGADGTSVSTHAAGVTVEHVWTAVDADEANYAVSKTVGKVAAVGDLLYGDAANSLAKLTKGTSGTFLKQGASLPAWTALASTDISDLAETIADTTGAMFSGNTETGITATYQDSDNTVDLVVGVDGTSVDISGGNVRRMAVTGDVSIAAGSGTAAITGLALSKLATQADQTILGNTSGGAAVPSALTPAQTMAMLSGDAGATFSMNSQKISALATPTATTDAATKAYVDKNRTYTETDLPGAGNYTTGQTVSTMTITDPGYNINVWIAGSLAANAQTLAYWEIQCYQDGVKTGGIIIPHAGLGNIQSYAVLGHPTQHTSGTNCTILIKINRLAGTGNFDVQANTGANNLLVAYYTWDGT